MIPVQYSVPELIQALQKKFKYDEEVLNSLKKANAELRDSHYKDRELTEMQSKLNTAISDLTRGFSISTDEDKSIQEWKTKHIKERHSGKSYSGAIGGRFSYHFTPTSIGVFGTIECDDCMAKYQGELANYKNLKHNEYDKKQKELKLEYDPSFDFQEP